MGCLRRSQMGDQPHFTRLFVYTSFIFKPPLFCGRRTCHSNVSGAFLSCLTNANCPTSRIKNMYSVDAASGVPVLPSDWRKVFYRQVDTRSQSGAPCESPTSIHLHGSNRALRSAETEKNTAVKIKNSSIRHSYRAPLPPVTSPPVFHHTAAAGCTSSMVSVRSG